MKAAFIKTSIHKGKVKLERKTKLRTNICKLEHIKQRFDYGLCGPPRQEEEFRSQNVLYS